MQGTWVQSLVWEVPTCCGAAEPTSHSGRARARSLGHRLWISEAHESQWPSPCAEPGAPAAEQLSPRVTVAEPVRWAWGTGCRLLARQDTPILSKEDRQRESVHLGPGEGKGLSWEGRGRSVGMRTAWRMTSPNRLSFRSSDLVSRS